MTQEEHFETVTSNGEKTNQAEVNGHFSEPSVSVFRQAAPQCIAVSAKNLLLMTFGTTLGFSTILIPVLQEGKDIRVTAEELTWISSLNLFLVPVGCAVSGPISQTLGRRKTMMLANLPFIFSWILYHYASNSSMFFASLVITGLTGGLLEAPVMTYVAEVTQPHLRGMLSATSTMAVILGIFTQMLTGSLVSWRITAIINIAYPLMCSLALCFVPESPYWLASKGRLAESESALCWLRGWVSPAHIKQEFQQMCESVKISQANNSEKTKAKLLEHYKKRNFYVPFMLVAISFFISTFNGSITLQTFAVIIFKGLNAPINKYTATMFLGLAELIATIMCAVLIHFTGKRKLTFFSISGTFLCFFFSAIYGYLLNNNEMDKSNHTWIPTTFMIGAAFFSHVGVRLLPWILAGEVFSSQVRSTATGIAGSMYYIFSFISNKTFMYMKEAMTLPGTFIFYACINLAGFIILYFILPETEGRTLKDIEEHFSGIQNLKHRPRKEELPTKEKWAATNPTPINDDIESKF